MINKIDDDIINELKESTVDIIGYYTDLSPRDLNFSGVCPFCRGEFTVNPRQKIFYCFDCKTGGSIFNLVMRIENVSFEESVEIITKRVERLKRDAYEVNKIAT